MNKKTYDLYLCSPLLWAGLKYEEALEFRMKKARLAMMHYKRQAEGVMQDKDKYRAYILKYNDSHDAFDWNRAFLDEIIMERKRIKDEERKT